MSKFEENDLPRLHIIQQLQRAKLSMQGGVEVGFRDGTFEFVTGSDAALVIDKYLAMPRPYMKEEYQALLGATREDFVNELQKLNRTIITKTGELTNGPVGKYR